MTKLKKQLIEGVAPITLAECVSMGDGTSKTVKDEIITLKSSIDGGNVVVNDIAYKIDDIKRMYPQCENHKGSFEWNLLTETIFDNCVKGDFWINDKTDKLYTMHNYLHRPGDVMYFDGENITPLRLLKSYYKKTNAKYDICIIGAGAGGMGASYALKDKGYNVVLIDKLDRLGGSHLHSIPAPLASPITGTWWKDIVEEGYNLGTIEFSKFGGLVKVGEGTEFEQLWRGSLYNNGTEVTSWGNSIHPSYWWTSQKYFADLKDKIDIRLSTEFLYSHLEDDNGKDKVGGIRVRDLVTGGEYDIYAEFFIDCSADAVLCRSNKTENIDYFIGSDPKSLYNENAYVEGYAGDKYKINTVECGYRMAGDNYLPGDKLRNEDRSKWKDFSDITNKTNGIIASPKEYHSFISTSTGNNIDSKIFIDKGNDYALGYANYRAKAHFKILGRVGERYAECSNMLGIRESYRVKCDKMLTQTDCEHRVSSSEITPNRIIALSSWWVDLHNDTSLQNAINNSYLNGIPYESIVPSSFSNVLIGSRCFGASHIALASFRLIRTMMSLGYACGHAMSQCVDSWLDDVRDIDINKLQSDIAIHECMQEMETYFSE